MAEATIPVDLRNPGQVFACLGLMEAVEILFGPAEGGYAWADGETSARFTLSIPGDVDPVRAVIDFIASSEVFALNAPELGDAGVTATTEKWTVPVQPFDSDDLHVFPFQRPESPAPLPVRLVGPDGAITVTHWGDDPVLMGRDNVKFWAGSNGYPGAALARDAVRLLAGLGGNAISGAAADPFRVSARQSSSFSFDWRRSYVPLDAGFSPNAHGGVTMVGFPLVELLAAIGLENARPERPDRRNRLAYRYGVSDARLPTMLVRPVLGCQSLGFDIRCFRMQLDWPGKEGHARCIIDSRED